MIVAQDLAAWHGREEVSDAEVREAAELILPHRMRRKPFSDSQLDREKLEETIRKHREHREQEPPTPPPDAPPPQSPPEQDQFPGTGEVTFETGSPYAVRPLDLPGERDPKKARGRRTQAQTQDRTGRYGRATVSKKGPPDLALDATLRAAAPHQRGRERGNLAVAIADPDLRHKVREIRIGHHILFVVDASGSMGANQRMVETKAAILSLLLDAYQKRERVGLVVFRGEQAHLVLPFTNSVEAAQKCLEDLPTGGKTPLPHALHLAHEILQKEKARHPDDAFLLVVISDGKANISMGSGSARAEVQELAAQLRSLDIASLVLDTEAGFLSIGCLPELAEGMGGKYYRLQELRAPEVVARIEDLINFGPA